MIWLYRLLYWPFFVILLPRYIFRLWRRGGRWHIKERFGNIARIEKKPNVKRLWIQAVSVGELNSIKPLLQALKENPLVEVALSVTTTTARKLAEEKFKGLYCQLFTFPLDNFVSRIFRRLMPDRILLVDSELWPELLHQAKKRKVPVTLINARLSDRSYRRLRILTGPCKWILSKISLILTATPQDTKRYLKLGANPEMVYQTGNLKFDLTQNRELGDKERNELLAGLGWGMGDRIIVGSSTWAGEEEALLGAYVRMKAEPALQGKEKEKSLKLLLVPRHAERRGEVEALLKTSTLAYHRRTLGALKGTPEVVLADTTGELQALTQLGTVVFVGKSLKPYTEGQSPIEAAAAGKPVLMGIGMGNFRDIADGLVKARGGAWVAGPQELALKLQELLQDEEKCKEMGQAAQNWYLENRGATQRTLEYLELDMPVLR